MKTKTALTTAQQTALDAIGARSSAALDLPVGAGKTNGTTPSPLTFVPASDRPTAGAFGWVVMDGAREVAKTLDRGDAERLCSQSARIAALEGALAILTTRAAELHGLCDGQPQPHPGIMAQALPETAAAIERARALLANKEGR